MDILVLHCISERFPRYQPKYLILITKKQFQERINATEAVYRECWGILSDLKTGNQLESKNFLRFQPLLAKALYEIQIFRKKIHSEKDETIERRAKFPHPKSFAKKMSRLKIYLYLLDEVIGIGKCLGDCFIWPFFDGNDILDEHAMNERQFHMPTGIGGLGEISFIERAPFFRGCLVLYHGITSFLRMGDVSLYNPISGNLVAIGEIKTTKLENNILSLNITLVGKKGTRSELAPLPDPKDNAAKSEQSVSDFHQFRLKKQVERIKNALKEKKTLGNFALTLQGDLLNELQEVLKSAKCDRFVFRPTSKTLLFSAYKLRNQAISKRLLNRRNFDAMKKVKVGATHLTQFAQSLKQQNGQIVLDWFYTKGFSNYSLERGTVPLLWWPLKLEHIRKIIFHEIVVSTIYSPVNFVQKLRDLGCEVVPNVGTYEHRIYKQIGNHRHEIKGFETFVRLIQRHLIPEDAIISSISNTFSAIETLSKPPGTVNINIHQEFSKDAVGTLKP